MDAHRGSGVQFGDFISQRSGDTPFNFIIRVKGEYRAWYNSKEVAERNEARASEVSRQTQLVGPGTLNVAPKGNVQEPQTSLEATVRSKVDALAQEYARAEELYRELGKQQDAAKVTWFRAYSELKMAERFLKELEQEDGREYPPEVTATIRSNLPEEVGYRRKRGRNRVGQPSSSEVGDSTSAEVHAGDTSRGE